MRCKVLKLAAICLLCSSAMAHDIVVLNSEEVVITQKDVEHYVKFRVPPERQNEFLSSPERIKQSIQNIFMIRELARKAQFEDEAQMDWQLAFQRESWLAEIAQEQVINKALADTDWEKMAKEYYLAESDKYMTQPRVDAAHILIGTDERTVEEARAIALQLRERLLAGEDFNELARKFSDDKSVEKNGGELGAFNASRMVKPFSDAAFAMVQPGSISEPVETEFGVHLIKLNKTLPAERRPFERVKGNIIKTVQASRQAAERERILLQVRGGEGAILNNEAIEKMVKQATSNQP